MITGTLPPVSNRASWPDTHGFEIFDDENDEAIDVSTATEITIAVRRKGCTSPSLTATLTGSTVEILDEISDGLFRPTWGVDEMRTLCAETYEIGITVEFTDGTVQFLVALLPVIDGIVS